MTRAGRLLVLVGTVGVITTAALLFTKKASASDGGIDFSKIQFSADHNLIQSRIDRILGDGFADWFGASWTHWDTPEKAMQGIFKIAVNNPKDAGIGWSPVSPKDTWQAYYYPSPSVAAKYGNNLPKFVRCPPKELFCSIFHKKINIASVAIIVGGTLATVLTAGAAAPIVAPAVIAAGADLIAPKGKTTDMVVAAANDYIKKNPDAFVPAPASSAFDGQKQIRVVHSARVLINSNNLAA